MFLEQTWKLLETCNASLKKDCESSCINNDKTGGVNDLMYFYNHVAFLDGVMVRIQGRIVFYIITKSMRAF